MGDPGYRDDYTESMTHQEQLGSKSLENDGRTVAGSSPDDHGEVTFFGETTVDEMLSAGKNEEGQEAQENVYDSGREAFDYDRDGEVSLSASGLGRRLIAKPDYQD
ncbi:MAG: hypothetical protein ABEJ99_03300 [Candidatus Nanohaloarchaea archaeon]